MNKQYDKYFPPDPGGSLSLKNTDVNDAAVIISAALEDSLDAGTALIKPVVTRSSEISVVKDGVAITYSANTAPFCDGGLFNPVPVENLIQNNTTATGWVGQVPTTGEDDIFAGSNALKFSDSSELATSLAVVDTVVVPSTDSYVWIGYVKKASAPVMVVPRFNLNFRLGTQLNYYCKFNPYTGEYALSGTPFEYVYVEDHGDWWLVCLMGSDTNNDNTSVRFGVNAAISSNISGGNDVSLTGDIIISHPMLIKADVFPGPIVIPTTGATAAITEQTIEWELTQAVKDFLSTAEGHATAIGALTCNFTSYMANGQLTSGSDGIIALRDTATDLFYVLRSGTPDQRPRSYDGTNFTEANITPDAGDQWNISIHWNSTAGTLSISINGPNVTDSGDSVAFDGAFVGLAKFKIGHRTETAWAIKNIRLVGMGGSALTPFKRVLHDADHVIHSTDMVVHTHPA